MPPPIPAPPAPGLGKEPHLEELERLRQENTRLRQDRRLYQELLASNSFMVRWDSQGRVVHLNQYALDFFGYRPEEIVGRPLLGSLIPEVDSWGRNLNPMVRALVAEPHRFPINENENQRANGERVWVSWRNHPVLNAAGQLQEVISVGVDITQRKRAEEALRAGELRYRVLFQSSPVALMEKDASLLKAYLEQKEAEGVEDWVRWVDENPAEVRQAMGLVRHMDQNLALYELFEVEPGQPLDTNLAQQDPVRFLRLARQIIPALAEGRIVSHEREDSFYTAKGNLRHVVLRSTAVPGHEDSLSRVVIALIDITERKRAEEELRASERKFRLIINTTNQGFCLTGPDLAIQEVNEALCHLLEYTEGDLLGRDIKGLVADEPTRRLLSLDSEELAQQEPLVSEMALWVKDGSRQVPVLTFGNWLLQEDGELAGYFSFVADLSRQKRNEEELRASREKFRRLSNHDSLTNLHNTRFLYQDLERLIAAQKEAGGRFSLIFLDLDHFKEIVDTHGHLNGSRAIREVAHTIRELLSEPSYAVAYAGDEFVVVLPGYDRGLALDKAREICLTLAERVFLSAFDLEVRLTASAGLATFPDDAQDMQTLLALADQALFGSKRHGRNRVTVGG
ncbi:MAG: PAS domain S-box protein [Deltaproteobacteria bacterium]|nr:PAS domain S-box protein [Deltaproteobacteria bacterium]